MMNPLKKYYENAFYHKVKRSVYRKRKNDKISKNKDKRILVILHLFYPDSWKEIRQYLLNLEAYSFDLIVTIPDTLSENSILSNVKQFKPNVKIIALENRGYDVGPFLYALQSVDLNSYDIVFKLQSKGVKRNRIFIYKQLFYGRSWFVNLFEGCLAAKNVHDTIDMICSSSNVGIVCAKNLVVNDPLYKENLVNRKLSEHGFDGMKKYQFVAGTCFAMSAKIAQKFKEIDVSFQDFDTVLPSRGVSLAHAIERYLAIICLKSGYTIYGNNVCRLQRAIKRPIEMLLQRFSSERLMKEPYVFDDEYFHWRLDNKLVTYKVKEIEVGKLKWYKSDTEAYSIKDCIPYRYLCGDKECYKEYAELHVKTGKPIMSEERFESLIHSMIENGYDSKHIILIDDRSIICDGQHRACFIAYKYGLDKRIKVMEISVLNKKQLLKMLVPSFVLKLYFRKKYRCD